MECTEESGSFDMPFWLDNLKERIGNNVEVISIVDSGCGNYDTLWVTSSLRGSTAMTLEISVMK